MSSVCADHKFQLQPSHQLLSLKKSLRDIDIPPRKLLTRRAGAAAHEGAGDMFSDEGTLFQKYLPHNDSLDSDDDSGDPYAEDEFRMFEFKVRRCTRSRSHDWTDCPFAHPGEKARRRDPRRFQYSGTVCPEYRRGGGCSRGDACEFSHGVFECWLHPSRYRTEACKDGKNCKRKVCFFAHTPRQLRVLPLSENNNKKCNNITNNANKHCCVYCHCCSSSSTSTCSPTSTLFGMSHFSPPLSPSSHHSPSPSPSPSSSRFVGGEIHNKLHGSSVVRYKDVFSELMCSLEGLSFGEASNSPKPHQKNLSWLDRVSFNNNSHEDQQQFILSPTITSPASGSFSNTGKCSSSKFMREEKNRVKVDDVIIAPDLAWVNDLLM